MEKIVLLGSGGHMKSVIDTIEQSKKYEIVGFLETEDKQNVSYKNYNVIGTDDKIYELYEQGVNCAFVTIGYMGLPTVREVLYEKLKKANFQLPVIIDQTAILAKDTEVEEGTFIGKGAIINAGAKIGKMCIINTGSILEHECRVEDYSHIAVGAVMCGNVWIGKKTFIGANATVIQGTRIGQQVIVGAGSVVLQNIADNSKVVGNPAKINK